MRVADHDAGGLFLAEKDLSEDGYCDKYTNFNAFKEVASLQKIEVKSTRLAIGAFLTTCHCVSCLSMTLAFASLGMVWGSLSG